MEHRGGKILCFYLQAPPLPVKRVPVATLLIKYCPFPASASSHCAFDAESFVLSQVRTRRGMGRIAYQPMTAVLFAGFAPDKLTMVPVATETKM